MKQTTIRLDDDLLREVKKMLVDLDKSFNEYVVDLIQNDLDKRKKSEK